MIYIFYTYAKNKLIKEGPHSKLPEDEFFDAVETGLDKIEEDMQMRTKFKQRNNESECGHTTASCDKNEQFSASEIAKRHSLWPEVFKCKYIC